MYCGSVFLGSLHRESRTAATVRRDLSSNALVVAEVLDPVVPTECRGRDGPRDRCQALSQNHIGLLPLKPAVRIGLRFNVWCERG